jgi:hypothetical protein
MDNIYECIIPRLQFQILQGNRVFVSINLNQLIAAIAEYKGISYEEELKLFNKYKNEIANIKDLDLNEFDEYEEVKD